MLIGLWNRARLNKENIFYAVLTVFLLERVRRGWNRIEARGRALNLAPDAVEHKQHWFLFRAALLYALPFVMPLVKYIFRSFHELSQYVSGLGALSNVWALAVVVLFAEALLAVVLYNLLGIYVERMNAALGFFRKIGRSVVDGSKVVVDAAARAGVRAGTRRLKAGAAGVLSRVESARALSARAVRSAPHWLAGGWRRRRAA
jgi:hypothetical protein